MLFLGVCRAISICVAIRIMQDFSCEIFAEVMGGWSEELDGHSHFSPCFHTLPTPPETLGNLVGDAGVPIIL